MLRRIFLYLIACPLITFNCISINGYNRCLAQEIQNLDINIEGDQILVNFDLMKVEYDREYDLYLYHSLDDFMYPLGKVTGDVGQRVKGSPMNKTIRWSYVEELGDFEGNISLEVRGKPYLPFIQFNEDAILKKFKRGKTYLIDWEGSQSASFVNFELYNES